MVIMEPFYSDHERLDERSLALHQLVAEKVHTTRAVLDKARENLRRWRKTKRHCVATPKLELCVMACRAEGFPNGFHTVTCPSFHRIA